MVVRSYDYYPFDTRDHRGVERFGPGAGKGVVGGPWTVATETPVLWEQRKTTVAPPGPQRPSAVRVTVWVKQVVIPGPAPFGLVIDANTR